MKRLTAKKIAIFVFFLIICGLAGTAHAGTYIGELKWELTVEATDDDEAQQLTLITGVTHMGDIYYLVQGYMAVPNDGTVTVTGSAILMGNKVLMTLNMSQQHPHEYRDTTITHVEIDISSWTGTWWGLLESYGTLSKDVEFDYTQGTIQLINE